MRRWAFHESSSIRVRPLQVDSWCIAFPVYLFSVGRIANHWSTTWFVSYRTLDCLRPLQGPRVAEIDDRFLMHGDVRRDHDGLQSRIPRRRLRAAGQREEMIDW